MRLLLIRHGQTPSNVLGALDTAVPGPGLTDLGHEQAAAVPDALIDESIGAIFASNQQRAQLTAAPLADTLALPVTVREGLREISAGHLEMKSDWESVKLYLRITFGWASGDLEQRVPGAENGIEALGRFDRVVEEIAQAVSADHGTAAVVAHGQIIRAWTAARAHNIDVEFAAKNILHNTGVIALEGAPDAGWTALSWTGIAIGGARVDEGAATGPGGEASDQAS